MKRLVFTLGLMVACGRDNVSLKNTTDGRSPPDTTVTSSDSDSGVDAGTLDVDSGVLADAGDLGDSGTVVADSGMSVDGGELADAGEADSGTEPDAGEEVDAGTFFCHPLNHGHAWGYWDHRHKCKKFNE